MSAKLQKSTLQSSKAKHKKEYFYCSPCGSSYDSNKKLYEHCSGLLHQVRLKENEKNYKPCCFMCKKTFHSLDVYGSHLHKNTHKDAERKFRRAIADGKTVEQLVKAKMINSPIPKKKPPVQQDVSTQEKPEALMSKTQPPPVNNVCETPNFSWNFDLSVPPSNYGNNYYNYPQQGFHDQQFQNYGFYNPNAYHWHNNQGNEQFNRFQYSKNNNPFYMYPNVNNLGQQQNTQQCNNSQPWRFSSWRNEQYFARRKNAYFNNQASDDTHKNYAGNVDNSQLNNTGVKPVQRQHIYYADHGKAESGDATKEDKTAIDDGKATGGDEGKARKRSTTRDEIQSFFESDRPARQKMSPQDYTFQLPESQKVDNSCSDHRETPKRPTKANKKTQQTPNPSFPANNDGHLQQSPKGIGGLGSPKNQQQLNAENLRNLVNLSCSRKDKFLLDKLMREYDQMTIKAAMNRMGQNLVTLVDKDAAKDVIASLSAFGLIEVGNSDDKGPTPHIPEQLMGQIEELFQRSCQSVHPKNGFGMGLPFQDFNMNRNGDLNSNKKVDIGFEKSSSVAGLTKDNCNDDFDKNLVSPATPGPAKNKNKKQKKKRTSKDLPSEFEISEHSNTSSHDYEGADSRMKPTTLLKKRKRKPSAPSNAGAQVSNQDGDTLRMQNVVQDEAMSSIELADQSWQKPSKASTPKKPTKSNKDASKNLTKSPLKDDVKSKKSKVSKLKAKSPPIEPTTKKTGKKAKNPKKKKGSNKKPIEDNDSHQEPAAQDMADSRNDSHQEPDAPDIAESRSNSHQEPAAQDMADSRNDSHEEPAAQEDTVDKSQGPETTVAEHNARCNSPCDFAASIKCELEDQELPDVIEEPHIKVENIEEDIIELEQSSPEAAAPLPDIPAIDILQKAPPASNMNDDNSSSVTIKAINFAIEEENIQCEIQHIERKMLNMKAAYERQVVEMKAAFERQIAEMKTSYERGVEEAEFAQEKLKERRLFVRQKCDSLLKSLLKSQDGRAIASSLKRIFSEIPNDLNPPEDENPLPNLDTHADIPITDLPQREPIQTANDTQVIPSEELNSTNESTTQQKMKRKRVDTSKKKSPKKAKMCSKKEKALTDTEKEEPVTDVKQEEPKRNIKMEDPTSPPPQMFPNCKDSDTAKLKQVSHFNGHVDEVVVLKIHKCRLYSCSNDGTIRQFKTKGKDNSSEMKCVATYTHRSDKVVAMEIVSQKDNQTFIITASQFGTLKKFDLNTGNCVTTLETKKGIVHINYRWGSLFVCSFDGNISRHLLMNLKELDSFPCSSLPITCVTTATEGAYRILCIGSGDGLITLKEAHSGLFIRSYALGEEYPFKIQVLQEDLYTLGCQNRQCRSIYIHRLLNGDLLQKIDILAGVLSMQVVSQNLIMLGGKFGLIRLCDPKAKTTQYYYGGGYNAVSSMCLHRNLLISGGLDGTIEACELSLGQTFVCNYGKCPGAFAYHEDIVYHIKKIHAGSNLAQCLTIGCDYTFQADPSDRLRHILTHVQLNKDQSLR